MHDPGAVDLLGHADLALVEQVEGLVHGVAHHASRLGRDLAGVLEGAFDEVLEMLVRHGWPRPRQVKQHSAPGKRPGAILVLRTRAPMAARKGASASVR